MAATVRAAAETASLTPLAARTASLPGHRLHGAEVASRSLRGTELSPAAPRPRGSVNRWGLSQTAHSHRFAPAEGGRAAVNRTATALLGTGTLGRAKSCRRFLGGKDDRLSGRRLCLGGAVATVAVLVAAPQHQRQHGRQHEQVAGGDHGATRHRAEPDRWHEHGER